MIGDSWDATRRPSSGHSELPNGTICEFLLAFAFDEADYQLACICGAACVGAGSGRCCVMLKEFQRLRTTLAPLALQKEAMSQSDTSHGCRCGRMDTRI